MQYFGWWADCPLDISACRAVYQVSYINLASKAASPGTTREEQALPATGQVRVRADHGRVPRRDHIAQLRRDGPRQGRRRRRVA